jgi:light-regulated signal transduction histidine kinase (bacteriophytochrome)
MSELTSVDLTNCDREPIHIPATIQSHGAMLVFDRALNTLLYASQNADAVIETDQSLSPGTDLHQIFGRDVAHDFRNAAVRASGAEQVGLVLGFTLPDRTREYDARVHTFGEYGLLEIEPRNANQRSAEAILDLTRAMIRRVSRETSVASIARVGARLVRALLSYDRVMIYRFLHNGAGQVIAEAKAGSRNSFMGQHFPASDIPYQARRLYLTNTIRMISDVDEEPIPFEPPCHLADPPVDMTLTQLRSVSQIHCQYLRNMGVRATMSMSIVVDGDLWGLIACHHDSPKVSPMPLRIAAELFGQLFSLQIGAAEHRDRLMTARAARAHLDKLVSSLSAPGTAIDGFVEYLEDFATLMNSDGAGLWLANGWQASGSTPDIDTVRALIDVIQAESSSGIWHTQELNTKVPATSPSAGAVAIPLSLVPPNYLICFRNEEAHSVEWAGEPVKQVVSTPMGDRLTPRGSFEVWREDVRDRSVPWTEADLTVAESIRSFLRDIILRRSELTAEERTRTDNRRRILNEELNHRVKNIIALVKSIAVQSKTRATSVAEYAASLEGRLRALAFAHDQYISGGETGDLATLVEAEAILHRDESNIQRVRLVGPSIRLDDRAFSMFALVVHEMVTNAAKYGALSMPTGTVDVQWQLNDAGDCELDWVEQGGPPVSPPSQDGFGSKLIQSSIEYDLGGTFQCSYVATGLQARFVIPARHVSLGTTPAPGPVLLEAALPPDGAGSDLALERLALLVVEDQSLIAMDLEATLRGMGAADVRLSPDTADAARQLRDFTPDVVILDFNLGTTTSEALADELMTRGVPFLFATGYGDNFIMPARFETVPVIRKPINTVSLAVQIKFLMQSPAEGGC